MKKKSALLNRIEELETIVNQQKLLIDQLNWEIQRNNFKQIPVGDCIMGGWHEYPNPWHSITPPICKKCGHQAPDNGPTFTISNTNSSFLGESSCGSGKGEII